MKLWILTLISALALPCTSFAWGKRGHAVVCEAASLLVSPEPKSEFMRGSSYDLAYYCNVPDLVWKKPKTYKVEWFNHFMDLEIFEREMKDTPREKPFELDRNAFNEAFPKIKNEAGRAWWRIRELDHRLEGLTQKLRGDGLKKDKRHELQADWLVTAGAIGHYVADLAQPLHVTENFDGQLTSQKGIHSFFEDALVDELFGEAPSTLEADIRKLAREKWAKATLKEKTLLELLEGLSRASGEALKPVLAADQKTGRSDRKKALDAQRSVILDRLSEGAVYLAEIWRRRLGWDFNGEKFYRFEGQPKFIEPPAPNQKKK